MAAAIPRLVGTGIRRPWRTVIACLVLVALGLGLIVSRFAMTTDTAALISDQVDWRRQERAVEAAFPGLSDTMLIVIDGRTPELAEEAAARLTIRMAADRAHYRRVRRPDGGDFLAREGLLFGSDADVRAATAALVEAQPLLASLAADPSLRGVADTAATLVEGAAGGTPTGAEAAGGTPAGVPTAGGTPAGVKAAGGTPTGAEAAGGGTPAGAKAAGGTPAGARAAAAMQALSEAIDAVLAGRPAFFSWQLLFAARGSALAPPARRLILAQAVLDHGALMPGEAADGAVAAAARALDLDAAHGVDVRLTGEVPLADEEFATLADNMSTVALVMLAAMLMTLWFAVRSVKLVAAIVATIAVGLIVTTATGLLAVGRFNLISVAFIPLFVGLGVDFAIQICVRVNDERARGADPRAALAAAAAALGAPLLLAAAAIFLGFGAFLPTAYVGIAELGIIAGLGMIIALGLSVTLLPALIMLLGPPVPRHEVGIAAFAPGDAWLVRHRRAVLWAFGGAMLVSIAVLPLVRFDFNPFDLRDPGAPAMRTLADLMRDPDRNPETIDVLARDRADARRLTRRLADVPEVARVISIDSFVPADQPAKLAGITDASLLLDTAINPLDLLAAPGDADNVAALRAAAVRLGEAARSGSQGAADAARLAGAFARLAAAPPALRAVAARVLLPPLDVMLGQVRQVLAAGPVDRATLPAELVADWVAPNGAERIELMPAGDPRDNAALRRFRNAVQRVTPAISGLPVATQAAATTVATAFVEAGVIAFVLVSLLLIAVLRDLRETAFTLAPVILSIFLTLASCVAIGQPINFANIIAFPLLFGVGVAFHIYFVMAWRSGATGLLASSLARAVLFSALATGSAFGSLWLSHHPGTASMGKILMISLIWTLVCALVFEPALLGPPRISRATLTH